MSNRSNLNLDVDLQRGVVPISKAASSLAALIKRASTTGRPVIVTQKGYPTGVLLPVELFATLKGLATDQGESGAKVIDDIIGALSEDDVTPEVIEEAALEEPAPQASSAAPRRRKRASTAPVEGDA